MTEAEKIDGLRNGLQRLATDAERLGLDREGFAATLIGFGHAIIEARDGPIAADAFLALLSDLALKGETPAN